MATFFDNMDEWSDSEEEEDAACPLTFAKAVEVTLGFGKYKGETIGSLLRTSRGREYMKWCLENFAKLYEDTRQAMELALSEFDKAKAARVVVT
jgi:hypothetical protein